MGAAAGTAGCTRPTLADDQIRAFLGRTYDLKAIADYETGPDSHISAERAREAIHNAKRFVETITGMIPV